LRSAEAQRRAGQFDAAARLLEPVADVTPLAAFSLALVREDQGRIADSRQLYQKYLATGQDAELRTRARDRLVLLDRLELQRAVRDALSHERDLASRPPEPRTIGVFPFLTTTADPQLHPLGTALAELLTTDLAQTDRLRVVERARVQDLLDEMRLAESRRSDPATAVRSGRMLGASTLVQGRIEGTTTELAVQAAVVRVPPDRTPGNPLRERDALTRLFDAEKRLALGVYDRMGIQLTTAERQRVMHEATRNIQALLELGYGLEAQDAGHYAEAAAHFARAAQLDPSFALAHQYSAETSAQARAAEISTQTLGQLAIAAAAAVRRVDIFLSVQRLVPDPAIRNPAAEALGAEGVGRRGTVDIVIPRP
jgi:TolB-like protein